MKSLINSSFSFIIGCCLLCMAAQNASAQLGAQHYRIWSVKEKKEVNLQAIVDDMENYDVVFFGEEHNDSVTHFLEAGLFEQLYNAYGSTMVLSMEMFDRDVQTVMDEYLYDGIREKSFLKDARTWSNYRDYKPMVEFAKKNKLDIICANAPTRYTNLAGRMGQQALENLSPASKRFFAPLPYDTASGAYYEKLMALTGHSVADTAKKAPAAMMGGFNMILSQSLWDATMAWSIAEYFSAYRDVKVMQVNGRFHSDEGFAAVTQLKNYNPSIRALIISTGSSESFPNIQWDEFKHLGDYIIITDPAVPKTYEQ